MDNSTGKKILLVEDEAIIAIVNKSNLEKYGYNVITVNTGEKAVEVFKTDPDIDLILMDIDLGAGIDGTETASLILKNRDIPVVFLSSHTEPEIVEKTEKITSYGYVVKSSTITVLDASIKMAFKLFDANRKVVENEAVVRKKLSVILEPESDIAGLNLTDIIDREAIRVLMEGFYKTTHISGAVLDAGGNVLVDFGWQDICTRFHRIHPETAKNCFESDVILSKGVMPGTYKAYKCKNNLWDVVTPIEIGGRHMGNIYLGQFFYDDESIDYELFRNRALQYGFDEKEYIAALDRVPRVSRESIDATMQFCIELARLISTLSYSTVKLSRSLAQNEISFRQLEENDEKQTAMISNISDVIVIIDSDGINRYKSSNIEKLFGWKPEELVGKSTFDNVHPEDLKSVQLFLDGLKAIPGATGTAECRYMCSDGSYKWIEITVTNLLHNTAIQGFLGNYHDITARREIEQELREEESRFKALHNASFGGISIHDKGIILECNQGLSDMTGYSVAELVGMDGLLLIAEECRQDVMNRIITRYEKPYEATGLRKNGEKFPMRLEGRNVPYKGREVRTVEFRDITEAKSAETEIRLKNEELHAANEELNAAMEEMEAVNEQLNETNKKLQIKENAILESNKKYRQLFDVESDAIFLVDCESGRFIDVNPAAVELYGYSYEEFLSLKAADISGEPGKTHQAITSQEKFIAVRLHKKRDGTIFPVEIAGNYFTLNNREIHVAAIRDITERKKTEDKIRSLLSEKELLLKEVYHRNKNYMNTIKSLLILQADSQKDSSAVSVLNDTINRIHSMSLLYDKLYTSQDLTGVSIDEYIPSLADEIIGNFPNCNIVKVDKNIDGFILDPKIMQPLGIIINEILTNIMKYAFAGRDNGLITISAKRTGGKVCIGIADNGIGMPGSVTFENSSGFGMQLIHMLACQIGAVLRIEREQGTNFILEFNI